MLEALLGKRVQIKLLGDEQIIGVLKSKEDQLVEIEYKINEKSKVKYINLAAVVYIEQL